MINTFEIDYIDWVVTLENLENHQRVLSMIGFGYYNSESKILSIQLKLE